MLYEVITLAPWELCHFARGRTACFLPRKAVIFFFDEVASHHLPTLKLMLLAGQESVVGLTCYIYG